MCAEPDICKCCLIFLHSLHFIFRREAQTVAELAEYEAMFAPWWEQLAQWGDLEAAKKEREEHGLRNTTIVKGVIAKFDLDDASRIIGLGSSKAATFNKSMQICAEWPGYPETSKKLINEAFAVANIAYGRYKSTMLTLEQLKQLADPGCSEGAILQQIADLVKADATICSDIFLKGLLRPEPPSAPDEGLKAEAQASPGQLPQAAGVAEIDAPAEEMAVESETAADPGTRDESIEHIDMFPCAVRAATILMYQLLSHDRIHFVESPVRHASKDR